MFSKVSYATNIAKVHYDSLELEIMVSMFKHKILYSV